MKNCVLLLSILSIYIMLLFACTSNKRKIVFEKEENISSVFIEDSPFIGLPVKLLNYENKLFISDFFADPLLTIFDLNENSVIANVVKKGTGPDEALPPLLISLVNDTLLAFNKSKFQLNYFLLNENYDISLKSNLLFQVPSQVSQLSYLNSYIYLASGYFKNGRYALLNAIGEIDRIFGDFPNFLEGEKDRPYEAKAMFHQIQFEINKGIKKVACLSSHVLDIIDFTDYIHVCQQIQLDAYDYYFSTGNMIYTDKTPNTSRGAIDITSTDKHIYVLFDYSQNHLNNDIWVFDWTGVPIKKITLDSDIRLITAIDDNLLYALALIGEDFKIVKLNLNLRK